MDTIKTIKPGVRGTKRFLKEYKDQRVVVCQRKKPEESKAYTTVELIVDKRDDELGVNFKKVNAIKNQSLVPLKIAFHEVEIRNKVKQAGGQWHHADKVWLLPYFKVVEFNLSNRMIKEDVSKYGHDRFVF